MTTFLTEKDMVELTGIRQGKDGRTREQRQVDTLRKMKIPHYVNAVGRPIVARAVIEGIGAIPPEPIMAWEPRLAHG
jgi:hypothetical protein